MDEEDICIACQWEGEPKQFIDILLNLCLLQKQADAYVIHDWKENNPYAAHSPLRAERARKGAKAKWNKYYGESNSSCSKQTQAATSYAPSPSPSPIKDKRLCSSDDEQLISEDFISKKKRKLDGKRLESFKLFWDSFNFKKGRAAAIDAWLDIPLLTNALVLKIVEAAKIEAQNRPGLEAKGQTPIWPQGWLTGRRWEDEVTIAANNMPLGYVTPEESQKLKIVRERYGILG
jgi:hypothetical protein